MTLATAMYWTGIDPMSKRELFVAKEWKDRKIQQALLQPHKPEHKEILRDYRSKKRRDAVGFVQKIVKPTSAIGRAISNVPKKKLGPKLLLDSR
jgi:hypothetical protein